MLQPDLPCHCLSVSKVNETLTIFSFHFQKNLAIHEQNIHLLASQKKKFKWFVYTIVDELCDLIYVGRTPRLRSR